MTYLKQRDILASMIFIVMVFFSCIYVDGYSYTKGEGEDMPHGFVDRQQSSELVKRMNQISCHCCSNSFNSHCCLQCMQRVGKRSEGASSSLWEDFAENIHDDYFPLDDKATNEDVGSLTVKSTNCLCCLFQAEGQQLNEKWKCCQQCSISVKEKSKPDA